MGRDIISDIITSIRNVGMDKKRVVRIPSIIITENTVKILFLESFIEKARKHREKKNKYFLVLTLRPRRNRKRSYRFFLIEN